MASSVPISSTRRGAGRQTLLAGISTLARRGVRLQVTEVNGQPGGMAFDAQDRLGLESWRSRLRRVRSRQSTPLPTPTSCGTS